MPPKKKSRKSTSKESDKPDAPLEYIDYIREQAGKRFAGRRKNVNYDIEQNTRAIQALLKINAEIFGRCMGSGTIDDEGKSATFTRYGFDVVRVCQNQATNKTQFITESGRSQQSFDIRPCSELPTGIDNVFVVQYQASPFDLLIDYDSFFNSAIMLHDDILEPFLVQLKVHIESIHVRLGKIESWLLEPKSNIEFIEATFEKKLEIPAAGDFEQDCDCPSGTHAQSDECLNCGYNLSQHRSIDGRLCCPNFGTYFRCDKKIHLLKSCNESGKFEKTFSVTKKNEQTKLKKFLEFMSS